MSVTLEGVLQILDAIRRYLGGGARWTKYRLDDGRGNKCLVGAALAVRARSSDGAAWVPGEEIDAARHYIEMAIRERGSHGLFGYAVIETFNDAQHSYRDIEAVISRAKELATASYYAQHRPAPVMPVIDMTPEPARRAPVVQILPPPVWPALPPPHASSGFFAGLPAAPVAVPPVEPRIAASPWTTPRRLPR